MGASFVPSYTGEIGPFLANPWFMNLVMSALLWTNKLPIFTHQIFTHNLHFHHNAFVDTCLGCLLYKFRLATLREKSAAVCCDKLPCCWP